MGHWVIKSKKINISYSKTLEYLFVEHKYWDGWASSKARMQDYCNQDPPPPNYRHMGHTSEYKLKTDFNNSQPLSSYLGWKWGLGGFTCARCVYSCQDRGPWAGHFLWRGVKSVMCLEPINMAQTGVTLYKRNFNANSCTLIKVSPVQYLRG